MGGGRGRGRGRDEARTVGRPDPTVLASDITLVAAERRAGHAGGGGEWVEARVKELAILRRAAWAALARLQVIRIPDGPTKSPPVDLAFGTGSGWQPFTLWILRRDGSLGTLCPVAPPTAEMNKAQLVGGGFPRRDGVQQHASSVNRDGADILEQMRGRLGSVMRDAMYYRP